MSVEIVLPLLCVSVVGVSRICILYSNNSEVLSRWSGGFVDGYCVAGRDCTGY